MPERGEEDPYVVFRLLAGVSFVHHVLAHHRLAVGFEDAERAGPSISMRLFAAEDVLTGVEGAFLTTSIKSRASASVELRIT
jgi:hypothetical protein